MRLAISLALAVLATRAWAACPTPPPCPATCPGFAVLGDILAMKQGVESAKPNALGCAVGRERPTLDGEGRWQQFTNGQIVTTPAIGMVVAVYRESVSCADRVVVEWKVRGFMYDEFWVRIDQDREEKRCPAGACTVDVVATSPSQGTAVRPLGARGDYTVRVMGCDAGSRGCPEGFSNRASLDYRQVDLCGVDPGDASTTFQDRSRLFEARKARGIENGCPEDTDIFKDGAAHFPGEGFAETALAKLAAPTTTARCTRANHERTRLDPPSPLPLMTDAQFVSAALREAKVGGSHTGTDVG